MVYGNPHVLLFVKTKDAQIYQVEWANLTQLARPVAVETAVV